MTLESVKTLVPDPGVLGLQPCVNGWNSERPEFAELVKGAADPKFIVEVGSWLGQSALRLAELCPNAIIVCVDHWCGSPDTLKPLAEAGLLATHLYFRQFLMNVAVSPHAARIFPLPTSSLHGARLIKTLPITPDLIFVDASHETPDVYMDCCAYYDVLAGGGTMFGDDWGNPHYPDLPEDVRKFAAERGLAVDGDWFWRVKKPRPASPPNI